jgi:hypothetical protein
MTRLHMAVETDIIIVNAKWRQWDELADALGIPARRYDESTFQRLERAVGAE